MAQWTPILLGEDAAMAIRLIRRIARLTADLPLRGLALHNGCPGSALLLTYCKKANIVPDDTGRDPVSILQAGTELLGEDPSYQRWSPALFEGLSGFAWTLSHISQAYRVDNDAGLMIDRVLIEFLSQNASSGWFDLIFGATGIGVYGLERLSAGSDPGLLAGTLSWLRQLALHQPSGIVWLSPREMLPALKRPHASERGLFDTGVAHGVTGVISFLSQCVGLGVDVDLASSLRSRALDWLRGSMDATAGPNRFPLFVAADENRSHRPSVPKLAWCYGDLGIAAALAAAAAACDEMELESEAMALATCHSEYLSVQEPSCTAITETGLCHGSAGIAHLLNRLYQRSSRETFQRCATKWYRYTLSLVETTLDNDRDHWAARVPSTTTVDGGLLNGLSGVALALVAAVSSVEPAWDRILLISGANHGR